MIEIKTIEIAGMKPAILGARLSYNSRDKIDSGYKYIEHYAYGKNDHELLCRLGRAGSDEAKYRRMIAVYCDINAPLYWWKQFDTYKVGTVALSSSTMHSIAAKEFTKEDFSYEHMYKTDESPAPDHEEQVTENVLDIIIRSLNYSRDAYLEFGKRKDIWWQMIQLLPSSYNQLRTVMMNYEVLANIYHSRRTHKLDEWKDFCKWAEGLPYSELFTGGGNT